MDLSQTLHNPAGYDFRQYDRVWQRVAPDLEPYPGINGAGQMSQGVSVSQGAQPAASGERTAAGRSQGAVPGQGMAMPNQGGLSLAQESQLPGAEPDPCCMGTEAQAVTEVVTGFIEDELGDRRQFLAMSRQSPSWARQHLRDMAAETAAAARQLGAAYYLITGECYQPALAGGSICVGRWCPALRERYHAEACKGLNYAQAADGTADICLQKIFSQLSADSYRRAEELMELLGRSMQSRC